MKEIFLKNGKTTYVLGLQFLILLKMFMLPKSIYRFKIIFIKIPMTFFAEIDKTFLKFVWNYKRPQRAKQSWKNKVEGITFPDFKIYYKAIIAKAICYEHKKRNID